MPPVDSNDFDPAPAETAYAPGPFAGRHLVASYLDCDEGALLDHPALLLEMQAAAKAAHARIITVIHHVFPGWGMTAVLLLAESHASIHTYPEHKACFVDIFTCGSVCKPENFDRVLTRFLKPARVECRVLVRGEELGAGGSAGCGPVLTPTW